MNFLPKDTIYHIYNRGNRKEKICFNQEDYETLQSLFYYYFDKRFFDLISFCIMPNHFHLLLSRIGDSKIEKAMQLIDGRYTKYINKKYGFVGHLFQGRYRKKKVTSLHYFSTLLIYIKKNPTEIEGFYTYLYKENEMLIKYYKSKMLGETDI